MTLVDFFKARLDEDEAFYEGAICRCGIDGGLHDPDCLRRVLAEVDAKRKIVELHESWPTLVETQPELSVEGTDLGGMTAKVSQRIAWLTTQEYRVRFGVEPPTSPVLRLLALPYDQHPDYREEWRP